MAGSVPLLFVPTRFNSFYLAATRRSLPKGCVLIDFIRCSELEIVHKKATLYGLLKWRLMYLQLPILETSIR